MQEIVASGSRKINTGKYENVDFFISAKVQVLDTANLAEEIEKLDEKVEFFLEQKEKRVREAHEPKLTGEK